MSFLSADIKYMPKGFAGYQYLLIITCEQTNFTIAVPLQERTTEYVAEAIATKVVSIFGPPYTLIVDEDKAFTADVIFAMLKALKCDLKLISPYNHGSSKSERQIQSISNIICKQLSDKGQTWPLFAGFAAYAMNTFASEALDGLSPYQLVFKKDPPDLTSIKFPAIQTIPPSHRAFYQLMMDRARSVGDMQLQRKTQQAIEYEAKNQRYKVEEMLQPGQIVYLLAPTASTLQSGTTKFRQDFIGPLVVDTPLDKTHYKLKDFLNRPLPGDYHINRIKRAKAHTPHGIVDTHQKYLDAIKADTANLLPQLEIEHHEAIANSSSDYCVMLDLCQQIAGTDEDPYETTCPGAISREEE